MEQPLSTEGTLEFLYNPRSVAMVGASATPGKIGSRILDHLLDNGYAGTVYPVNPGTDTIGGLRCYPNAEAIPEPVDVAYILVPADAAVEATWQLGRAGAKAAIIAAAGFAETNTDRGRAREQSLMDAHRETGIRIVGPNCNGIYNATDSVSIGFNTAHALSHPAGGMGVISHSGALFSTLMLKARQMGVGLSKFASVGNEADLDVLDFMEDLAHDQPTRCICLIIDSLPDGHRFTELAAVAHNRCKRIVALKLGTTAEGASAAVAHSSRLAGRAEAYASLFRHCGVGTVDTIEQLVSAAALVDLSPELPSVPRLGVAAMSGGAGTVVADSAIRHGVDLPSLSPETMARINEVAPGAPFVNPIDIGAAGGRIDFPGILTLLREDDGINVILHYYHPMHSDEERQNRARTLIASQKESVKPHLLLAPGGLTDAEEDVYRREGIRVLSDTDVCMAAVSAAGVSPPAEEASRPPHPYPQARVSELEGSAVDDVVSMTLIREAGIPVARFTTASTVAATCQAAEEIGYPIVLKGLIPGLAHKSDLDLVVTGITDPAGCETTARKLLETGAYRLLVQEHVRGGIECLAGLVTEPNLGRFVIFGLGGIYAEALADTALVPVTASRREIGDALGRTGLGRILRSPRLRLPDAFDQVASIIERLAALGQTISHQVAAVDINPLVIGSAGVVAVDALVVTAPSRPSSNEGARARRR